MKACMFGEFPGGSYVYQKEVETLSKIIVLSIICKEQISDLYIISILLIWSLKHSYDSYLL